MGYIGKRNGCLPIVDVDRQAVTHWLKIVLKTTANTLGIVSPAECGCSAVCVGAASEPSNEAPLVLSLDATVVGPI